MEGEGLVRTEDEEGTTLHKHQLLIEEEGGRRKKEGGGRRKKEGGGRGESLVRKEDEWTSWPDTTKKYFSVGREVGRKEEKVW
jgi:hypothetical protein